MHTTGFHEVKYGWRRSHNNNKNYRSVLLIQVENLRWVTAKENCNNRSVKYAK